MDFTSISDEALLSGLSAMMGAERRLGARVVAYLLEVQDRRLDLKAACSSLFDFCTRRLGMSEGEAFRRINAARLVRKFPRLLGALERGEIHLSALVLLRDHLTEGNWEELVRASCGKSKREVQELLAARFPKPDAPTILRLLPSAAASVASAAASPSPNGERRIGRASSSQRRIEPLSRERYKLQLTISRELHGKIERATRLLRHRNPTGDLAAVLEQGIDLLIAKLEKERLGKSERPRNARTAKHGYVTRAARRDVFARDGERCSFVGKDGQRCNARAFLEIDHVRARARGGCGDASNLQVLCRAHNLLLAEETFGRHHVEDKIARQRRRPIAGDVGGVDASHDEVEHRADARRQVGHAFASELPLAMDFRERGDSPLTNESGSARFRLDGGEAMIDDGEAMIDDGEAMIDDGEAMTTPREAFSCDAVGHPSSSFFRQRKLESEPAPAPAQGRGDSGPLLDRRPNDDGAGAAGW